MAQSFIDFSDVAVGAFPSEFTSRWASTTGDQVVESSDRYAGDKLDAMGTRSFRVEGDAYKRKGWEWVAGSSDDEIRALVDIGLQDNDWIPALVLRGAGTTEASRTGYHVWLRPLTGNFLLRRLVSGSETTLDSGTLPDLAGALAEVEFSAVTSGSDCILEVRYWEYGTSRPVTADLSYTDATPLAVGWCGPSVLSSGSSRYSFFGRIGVGTDGDAAPTAPVVASATPTLTLPSASSITANSIVPNVSLTF